jgi:DNA-binding IclR family transcriptional regulator
MKEQYSSVGLRSVHLALDVLEAVAGAEDEIGVSEVAAQLKERKGTVFRHLRTLTERGYLVQRASNQRYRLGIRAHLLSRAASDGADVLANSTEAMNALRDATGQSVVLSAVGSREMIVLDTVLGTHTVKIGVKAGSDLPMHASAQGIVALAHIEKKGLLERSAKNARFRDLPPIDLARVQRELPQIARRGWAAAPEEIRDMLGINALAAPILDEYGTCVAAIAIVGLVRFVPIKADARQIAALRTAAAEISSRIGYRKEAIRA